MADHRARPAGDAARRTGPLVSIVDCRDLHRRASRGFTLIEMVVVLSLITVLAGLSYSALSGLKNRGTFVSSSGDLLEGVRRTRAEAFSSGAPCVFIIDTVAGRWWSMTDVAGSFSLATFSPATPAPAPAVLLASGIMASGVSFGPAGSPGGYGTALPQPYAGVPSYSGATPSPNFPYCSFCSLAAPAGYGAITFYGAGGAAFSGGGAAIGHQFTVQAPKSSGSGLQIMTIAVVARTGAITNFETAK